MATITTKIGLDAKEFLASLSDVNAKIKTALADNTTKIKVEADTTALKNPLGALPTIEPIKVPIEPIKVPPIEIPINPEKLATEFDTAKSQAIGAAQQIKSALASAFSNGANEKEISKLTDAFKDATKEVDKLTEAEKQAEKAVEGISQKGSGLGKLFDANQFSQAISGASGALNGITQPFVDFQKGTAELSSITGVSGDALDNLADKAKDLASQFGGSATGSLDSFKGILSRLGPAIAESPEGLGKMAEAIGTLSAATGDNAAASMDALTTSMLQFGVDVSNPIKAADEMQKMMNVLAAGAKEGASEVPQVSDAIKVAGVAASGAKVSFEETNAAIQALAAGGKFGAEAGTALRNVLGKLGEGRFLPEDVQKELTAAGVSIDTLGNKTLPLTARLNELKKIQSDSALVTKFFGAENAAAASVLLRSTDNIDSLTQKLTGTQTAFEQAAINQDTISAKLDRFKARVENAFIGLGDTLGAPFAFISQSLGAIAPQIGALAQLKSVIPTQAIKDSLVKAIGGVDGDSIGSALGGLFSKVKGEGGISEGLSKLVSGGFSGITDKLSGIVSSIGSTFSSLGSSIIGFFTSPIGIAIGAITALIAAFVLLYKNSESFRTFIDGIVAKVKDLAAGLVEIFTPIGEIVSAAIEGIKFAVEPIIETISDLFGSAGDSADSFLGNLLEIGKKIFLFTTPIGLIITGLKTLIDWFRQLKERMIQGQETIDGLIHKFSDFIKSIFGANSFISKLIDSFLSLFKGAKDFQDILIRVSAAFYGFVAGIKNVVNNLGELWDAFTSGENIIKKFFSLFNSGAKEGFDQKKTHGEYLRSLKEFREKSVKELEDLAKITDLKSADAVAKFNARVKELQDTTRQKLATAQTVVKDKKLLQDVDNFSTALFSEFGKYYKKVEQAEPLKLPPLKVEDKAQVAKKAGAKAGEQAVVDLTDAFKKVFEEGVKINQETKIELTIDPVAKAQAANNNALRNDLQKLADDQQKELDKYIDANNKQQKQVADRYKKALEERNAKLADLNEKSTETDKVKLQAETKKRLDALAKADAELGAANQDVKNLLKGVKTTLTVSVVGEDGIVRLTNQVVEGAKAWELYNQKSGEVAQLKIKNNERKNSILIEEDIYNKYVERINKQRKYEEDYAKISLKLLESQLIKTAEITKQISALKLEALQEQQDKERETFILNTEDYKRRATEIESLFNAGFLTAEQKITSLQNAKYDVEVKLTADKTTQEGRAFSDIITNQKLETRKLSVELGIINSQAVITGLANEVEQTYQQALLNAQKKFDEALKNSGGNKRIVQEATITLNSELYRAEIEKIKAENPKLVIGLEFAETLSEELQKVSKKISEENAKFKVEDKAHEQRIAAIRAERDELIKLYRSGEISANQYHDKVIENTKRLKDELNSSTSGSLGNIGKVLTESLSSTFGVLSAKYGKSADEAFTRVSKANEANITAQERVNKLTAAGKVGTAEYQEALQIQSEASAAATSAQSEAFTKLGISAALGFGEALAAGKNMSEALPLLIFDSLEKAIPSLVALILGQSLAANPIAGLFVSAGLTAALYAAVAVARASLADGAVDIKQGIRTRPDKRDTIPAMLMVGESVITAQGTQARGNLEAFKWVNATGGSLENYFNQPKILMHEVIGMKQAADIAKTNSELQSILAEQNNIIINLHKTNVEQQKLLQGIEHKIAGTQTAIIPPSTDKLHQHYKLEQRKANSL